MATTIAVYGATGFTGGRVAKGLLERGHQVVLGGRNPDKLKALAHELGDRATVRLAALDDATTLADLCEGADAVINCAAPAAASAEPVSAAAIAAGAHYLDTCAEQVVLRRLFEETDRPARDAGVAVVPSCAFDAGLSDLLIAHAAIGLGAIKEVTIAYGVTGWRPSRGTTRSRLASMRREWLSYEDGELRSRRGWPATEHFEFPAPLGRQRVMVYPTPDAVTVPRHTEATRVKAYMTTVSLSPKLLGPVLPVLATVAGRLLRTPLRRLVEAAFSAVWRTYGEDKMEDRTSFVIAVRIAGEGGTRNATVRGRGLYTITAPLMVEAATRLLADGAPRSGALAPAEAFEPKQMLDGLAAHGLEYEVDRNGAANAVDQPLRRTA